MSSFQQRCHILGNSLAKGISLVGLALGQMGVADATSYHDCVSVTFSPYIYIYVYIYQRYPQPDLAPLFVYTLNPQALSAYPLESIFTDVPTIQRVISPRKFLLFLANTRPKVQTTYELNFYHSSS